MAARAFAVLALAAILVSTPTAAEEMKTCGSASYFPLEYTCYNNSALCPISFTRPSVSCGAAGCYAPEQFSCEDGTTLKTLPDATSPFTLTAFGNRPGFGNMTVKACGNYLAIGANARECAACSSSAAAKPGVNIRCSEYGNRTVLLPGGQMVRFSPSVGRLCR
jgi:hypothetical protein